VNKAAAAVAALLSLLPAAVPRVAELRAAGAQLERTPLESATHSAGLQWRFVRIKYHYDAAALRALQLDVYGEPWGIDSPAAEQNLSRRVKTATSIAVEDPILLTLEDPQLFEHPWIYIVEPGALRLNSFPSSKYWLPIVGSRFAHVARFGSAGGLTGLKPTWQKPQAMPIR